MLDSVCVCYQDVIKALQQIGHNVTTPLYFYNTVNAVSKHGNECVDAISDHRKKGEPAGYWTHTHTHTRTVYIAVL